MLTHAMLPPALSSFDLDYRYVGWLDPWAKLAGFVVRSAPGAPDGGYVRLRPSAPGFRSPALRYIVPVCAYGTAFVMFRHIPADRRGAGGSGRHGTILWRAATLTRPPPAGVPPSAWKL